MQKLTSFMTLCSLMLLTICKGQETQATLKISDLSFKSIFGATPNDPKSIYCLLGTGFLRAPSSHDSDSLIIEWINAHPEAVVIPVSSFGPINIKEPESKMVYCWVIEGNDTLNNFIIKNGCFPGGTMMRPKTWNEMEKWEQELHEDVDEKPDIRVYVDKKAYDSFIEQIKTAELYARTHKLGIWQKETEE